MSGTHAMVLHVPPSKDDPVALRLGAALKLLREGAGLTQAELARRMGGIPQGRISQWESGSKRLQLHHIELAEDALNVIRGAILAEAGYVAPAVSARAALAHDEDLQAFDRKFLVESYDMAWRKSQAARDGDAVSDDGQGVV